MVSILSDFHRIGRASAGGQTSLDFPTLSYLISFHRTAIHGRVFSGYFRLDFPRDANFWWIEYGLVSIRKPGSCPSAFCPHTYFARLLKTPLNLLRDPNWIRAYSGVRGSRVIILSEWTFRSGVGFHDSRRLKIFFVGTARELLPSRKTSVSDDIGCVNGWFFNLKRLFEQRIAHASVLRLNVNRHFSPEFWTNWVV